MRKTSLLLGLAVSLLFPALSDAQYAGPQTGQKVAFWGDSITAYGYAHPSGYVQLVAKALEQEGFKVTVIPAGVGGNTSQDMLGRVDADVINKKPDWMTLSCGVNDVWHGAKGVPFDQYQKNITDIVTKAQAAGIKVMILTSTMITEDQSSDFNQKLTQYNDFLRSLAKEKGFPLADLNAAMQTALANEKTKLPDAKGPLLTVDGVHMNPVGDQMMASTILKAWGMTDAQIADVTTTWNGMNAGLTVTVTPDLTVSQYLQLRALAAGRQTTVNDMISSVVKSEVDASLKDSAPVMPATTTSPATTAPSTNAAPAKP
jgi:lysophospholipase L1-like esterase